ncbi:uncharacterized protein BKA55DRAFT_63042 [Fusarium redolens]|uniref:HNH nuclease domain-containing protein n=1 Tax=Fusarium redolens TaxID=48865 RepID=A0A9P9GXC5_FUSRE|nr:uncharacterized protein BKA55DRAFT_544374 [Fusarium redolens]XP_046047831.1 uncharacterized protein BKA55DRAFT_63042 [Fusarium redolens]KAH7233900.1 hypothetical protein BKA55DRAFT_544374 [Fusarium redolens]KAH7247248.1 hypothetical protein BKA55DRAFT_63042 [Fusarium redolens]
MASMDGNGETNLFSTNPTNAAANYIPLRNDIYKIFNERHFCLVLKEPRSNKFANKGERVVVLRQLEAESTSPKGDNCRTGELMNDNIPPNTASQARPYLIAHVFNSTPSGQLPRLWHNRRVHTLPSTIPAECLFARFTWTVFSPTIFRDFLYATEALSNLVWDPSKSEHEVQEASPERYRAIYTASRSLSESPTKRSWIDIDRQQEEDNRRPKEDE